MPPKDNRIRVYLLLAVGRQATLFPKATELSPDNNTYTRANKENERGWKPERGGGGADIKSFMSKYLLLLQCYRIIAEHDLINFSKTFHIKNSINK